MPRPPKQWGAVNEIVPADRLLPRAREIAEELASLPPLATSYTRIAMTQKLRRIIDEGVGYGLALGGHLRGRSCSLQKRGLNYRTRRAASRHDVHPHSEEWRMSKASKSQSNATVESGLDAARMAETGSQGVRGECPGVCCEFAFLAPGAAFAASHLANKPRRPK